MEKVIYDKRTGTCGISGQLYEQKLALYFLLRGTIAKEADRIEKFYLGSNLNCVSGHDDVVFRCDYKANDEPKSKLFCVQSKHKATGDNRSRPTVTWEKLFSDNLEGGDFNLKSYLNSYLENAVNFSATDCRVLRDRFCDCEFALYTNAKFEVRDDKVVGVLDDFDFLKLKGRKQIKLDSREDAREFGVLKIPFRISKLLKSMINVWVEKKRIYKLDYVYQAHREHLEKHVIRIDRNRAKFRDEFFDGDTSVLPEEIIFLRRNFLSKARVKLKMSDRELVEHLKGIDIAVEKGHGKIIEYETKDKLFEEIPDDRIDDFFKSFTLISDQPDEDELERLIKDQMQLHYGMAKKDVDLVYVEVCAKVEKWWKEERYYITEKDDWFGESMKNHSIVCLKDYLKRIGLAYEASLKCDLNQNKAINIVCPESTELLFRARVYGTLNEMRVEYMMLDNVLFHDLNEKVIEAFECEYDVLVIVDVKSRISEPLAANLIQVLENNPEKKLILIGEAVTNLRYQIKSLDGIGVGFDDLKPGVQKEILNGTTVELLGRTVTLDRLVSPDLFCTISDEMLVEIVKRKSLVVGRRPQSVQVPLYIPRMLQRSCFVNRQFLESNMDRVALSGDFDGYSTKKRIFDFEHYSKNTNFDNYDEFLLRNPGGDFALLAGLKPVHWLKCHRNNFIWTKSSDNLHAVRKCLIPGLQFIYGEEELNECDDRFVVVAAEAGMGKTTLLSNMFEKPIDQLFKYSINLLDHSKEFASHKKLDALQFLRKVCLMEDFEYKLFEVHFKYKGSIVLYFNGFDEISPDYKEVVLKLFCDLEQSKVEKIFITTRLSVKEDLENTLNSFAYSLMPFSEDDQKTFLKSYWKKDDDFVNDILNRFSREINDELRNFIGIPLQLKMLVEVYNETIFDREINLFKMYDRFFKKKYYDVQCREKGKVDLDNLWIKKAIEFDYNDAKTKLGKLAMIALYGNSSTLLFKKEIEATQHALKNEIIQGKERSGVINCVADGVPKFVHRTFAEFFAATWLVDAFRAKKAIDKFLKTVDFLGDENAVVRKFFDLALCEDNESCRAVLRNDQNAINALSPSEVVSARDNGGRTLLHLAISEDNEAIASKLIEKGADVTVCDAIFSWTPLSYADSSKNLRLMDFLLHNGAKPEEMFKTIESYKTYSFHRDKIIKECAQNKRYKVLKYLAKEVSFWWNFESDLPCQTLLHAATKNGDLDRFQSLLGVDGNDASMVPSNGFTLLHAAAFFESLDLVKYITKCYKQFINVRDYCARTPLFIAAEKGNFDIVKVLVEAGARINMKTFIWTPLDAAQEKEFGDVVELLSHNGAVYGNLPNSTVKILKHVKGIVDTLVFRSAIKNDKIDYAFHILNKSVAIRLINRQFTIENKGVFVNLGSHLLRNAIIGGNTEFVEYVLRENNMLINIMDDDGNTPLHLAALNGRLAIVKFLIEHGSDESLLNDHKETCLLLAIQNEHLDVVKCLVPSSRMESKDHRGDTPLHLAVSANKLDIVKLLTEQGADPMKKNAKRRNCLHVAAEKHLSDILFHLLSTNAQCVDVEDDHGNTLLHFAAANNEPDIVRYLLQKGAQRTKKNHRGKTCLHIAIENGHMCIVSNLLDDDSQLIQMEDVWGTTPAHLAASEGRLDILKYLLEKGADPMSKNKLGWTPLNNAIEIGHVYIVEYLLAMNVECLNTVDNRGNSPLHMAVVDKKVDVIRCLLNKGADVMIRNKREQTAAHVAVQYGLLDVLESLVSTNKECVDVENHLGDTPLHVAVHRTRLDIVEFLLKNGASVGKRNKNGQTPLNLAVKMKDTDVLECLRTKNRAPIGSEDYAHVQQVFISSRIRKK